MIQSLSLLAQAAAPAAGEQAAPAGLGGLLNNGIVPIVLFIVIFWVLLIRPQRKAQKEHRERLQQLAKGDKVVTGGGLHGMVEKVNDTTINLKVADGVIITLEKNSVVAILK